MRVLLLGGVLAAVVVAFVVRAPIPFYGNDFATVYAALRGFWAGIDVYDGAALSPFVAQYCPGGFDDLGYPPWLVLTASGLALLPVDQAGRVWMLVNMWLVFATVHLLTTRWTLRDRVIASGAAAIYAPTLLLLFVGQFTMFVTFGAALLIHAARRESAREGGVGLALMSFKPHLGAMVILPMAGWLALRARPMILRALLVGSALAAAGFVVSTSWPLVYPRAAARLMADPRNVVCDTCSSAVSSLGRDLTSGQRIGIATVLAAGVALLVRRRRPDDVVAAAIATALLVLPYVRNYDYVLMIVPLTMAWERQRSAGRLAVAVAWALPYVTLIVPRRLGAYPLWISALVVVVVLLWLRAREDVPSAPAEPAR